MRRVASALADWDPKAAMDWAVTFGEGPYGRGAYRRVAIRTARVDGRGTMDWLGSLPAGPQRDGAVQESYRTWLSVDSKAADAWMLENQDADWVDPANAIYAQRLMVTQGHEAALAWCERIEQHLRKQRTATKIARAWYQREPEAARAWVENVEWLTEANKEQILVQKKERPARRRRQAEPSDAAAGEAATTTDTPAAGSEADAANAAETAAP
jgi:hypothetical protein